MKYLIDTDICVAFLNGRDRVIRERLLACHPDDVALCSVVKAELVYGARASERVQANLERLREFFAPFVSLAFDDAADDHYSLVRAQLRREGTLIGSNDLLIASIALANNLAVVTKNRSEFERVPGLALESW